MGAVRACVLSLIPLLAVGCSDNEIHLPSVDPIEPVDEGLAPVDPGACGFEDGDLSGFGHPGESELTVAEGGRVFVVQEGADFSALAGEETLDMPAGTHAALLRSNDAGDPGSVAVLTTVPFVPVHPVFVMDQLSELGVDGVALSLRVLDEDGEVLEERDLAVWTGGFVPALLEHHDPIPGAPWIDQDSYHPGEFTRTLIDVSPWHAAGDTIQLQFRQYTLIEHNGFFTLLDNLCDGEPEEPAA